MPILPRMQAVEILTKYWGHNRFRPLQEEIINSVVLKQDTLAILPTGGGKSICFQIPGLILGGITLVVSPLISLMNDQVENLRKKGLSALAFHSGLSKREADIEYMNFKNGKYKFVYVSPERLKTEQFKEIIALTNVTLLAVDEAHCISQWGYDFRPEYLLISEIRTFLSEIPCIALTASATPKVEKDILKYLNFNAEQNIFRQTIIRPNLKYVVLEEENKNERLLKIVIRLGGTGIVYVKNRKSTAMVASLLNKNNIKADYYHAGLTYEERNKKQELWQSGSIRIIVCTNAFGMGIDKGNVRFVVHYDIPESPEAYYQEAGRAGRDGADSWCILMYCQPDMVLAEQQLNSKFLDKKKVEAIFVALCNQLQLSYGAGCEETFEFDSLELAKKYNFSLPEIHTAFNMMQKDEIMKLSDAYSNPSRLLIISDNSELYRFYLKNPTFELFIKTILRMYGGIFDNYIHISEFEIANNLKIPVDKVKGGLLRLTNMKHFDYIPQNLKPTVTFLVQRPVNLPFNQVRWQFLKQTAQERLKAIFQYAIEKKCRQQALSKYFGENESELCGKCDLCRARKSNLGDSVKIVKDRLSNALSDKSISFEDILILTGEKKEHIEALRFLMDTGKLKKNKEGLYRWQD